MEIELLVEPRSSARNVHLVQMSTNCPDEERQW